MQRSNPKKPVLLEISKGIFRLPDEAHGSLRILEAAQLQEILEPFAAEEQVGSELS